MSASPTTPSRLAAALSSRQQASSHPQTCKTRSLHPTGVPQADLCISQELPTAPTRLGAAHQGHDVTAVAQHPVVGPHALLSYRAIRIALSASHGGGLIAWRSWPAIGRVSTASA